MVFKRFPHFVLLRHLIHLTQYLIEIWNTKCAQRFFGITFIGYDQYRNIGKQHNIKVCGISKTSGAKQDSQNLTTYD